MNKLNERDWYVVCKYYPHLAKRSRRKPADVGPHNPLDRKVRMLPVRNGLIDSEPVMWGGE